ncbi:hypothetical protein [Clostridium sp.]|uniref:hypothetical protein n=1 Tax=Clostridium sp. TaxID=1506 RepID=UPI001D20155E|nr:hypothetical protein [Clostridium sp.]MBS5305764.1 hypothetical protein [Clostridium sp.]
MTKKSKKKIKETELQKAFNWINSLSGERVNFIREYSAWQSKKDLKNAVDSFDRALSASVISVLDVEWEIVEMIQEELIKFVDDDIKKMNENKSLYGGLEMAIKKINETEKELVVNINGLIDKGFKQKEMIEKLVMDFPMLSKAMITNAVKKVRAERVKNTEDAATYILQDNKNIKKAIEKEDAKKIAQEVARQIEKELEKEHIAEYGQMAEENKEEKAISKLKIKKVELEGEFGSYIREGNKVIAGEITFNSLEELEEYQRKEIELFNKRMEEIREVYKIG